MVLNFGILLITGLSPSVYKENRLLTKSFTTVQVIFDRYKTESLNSRTRAKRTSGKAVRYQVIDSINVCCITKKQFLSHVLTKRD